MKKSLLLAGILSLAMSVFAQESDDFEFDDNSTDSNQEQLVDAPKSVVDAATETCEAWAKDEEVEANELENYMKTCINEELIGLGYRPIH